MKRRKPALIFIFITLVLDILGIGLIVPILPELVGQLRGGNQAEGAFAYGLLFSIYAIMQFFFAPILGALSDRYGRRKVILLSLFGAGLDYFLLAWAPHLAVFFIARVISGITSANISVATAYIADISSPEKRAANFGLVGAAFGLGFSIGPALGGLLAGEDQLRLPFIVAGMVTLANWLFGFFILPESLKEENRKPVALSGLNPFKSLGKLGHSSLVLGLAIIYFILSLGHQVFPALWALYSKAKFGWNPRAIGLSLAFVGVMAVVVQGGLVRKLIPKLGEKRSALFGCLVSILAIAGYGLAESGVAIYIIIFFGSLGGIMTPALQGIVSLSVGDDEQGEIQGSLSSMQSIASGVGPLLFTFVYGLYVDDQDVNRFPEIGFYFASLLYLVGLILMILLFRRVKNQSL